MDNLVKSHANCTPLTPITFFTRAAKCYANGSSIIHEGACFTWQQTYERCCRLAFSLRALNIATNHVVSVVAPNIRAMYEMHFAVPMAGAILNTINTRLDANTIATILQHSEAKILFVDYEFVPKAQEALQLLTGKGTTTTHSAHDKYYSSYCLQHNSRSQAKPSERHEIKSPVQILTGGAPPPPSLLEQIESLGFHACHTCLWVIWESNLANIK